MTSRALVLALLAVACSRHEDPPKPAAVTPPAEPEKPDPFLTFATAKPAPGDVAPGYTLTSTSGMQVTSDPANLHGGKPFVLVFASFTCPPSRMKLPGFEALAARWRDAAEVYVIYQREAHPHAKSSERLNGFADQVQARDRDGDGNVTVAEYGDLGPRYMFDAFDLDHDGTVRSYEFLAARRLDQFKDIDAPTTQAERIALARRLRDEIPGDITILVDSIDDAVGTAYGALPNMAYVIDGNGKVSFKMPWAAVGDIERELSRLTGIPASVPAAPAPDLAVVEPARAAAAAAHKPLLVEFTAIGCHACEAMTKTLAEPAVATELARFEVARLGIDRDPAWGLFEALQLAATPAFVALDKDGKVVASLEGGRDRDAVLAFLRARR